MRVRGSVSVGVLAAGLGAAAGAAAQGLKLEDALLMLDYQVVKVKGDEPIDLLGFHVVDKVADSLYLGAGVYAPHFKGVYGGFTAWDIKLHAQPRLTERLFATAGVALGGGAGGRSTEESKTLSGTGGFYKLYAGLGWDLGDFSVGLNVSKIRFRRSAIDGTQANVFLQVPFQYLTGPFSAHGRPVPAADAERAAASTSERMLSVVLDNFSQRSPQGNFKGSFGVADLQFSQYFAPDTYWFAGIGVGYRGMPLYNHVLGGVGQRLRLSPAFTLYGQLALGSGGYAPDKINTDSGFLVYPRVSAEYALSKDWGVALSAGYMVAPEGTSKNTSFGLGLTRHLRSGRDATGPATFQAYRVALFQQTEVNVRYRDVDRGSLNMVGIQADAIFAEHWYVPLQAAVAYSTYLGYAGYGELLAGLGWQTSDRQGERLQAFAELMGGTNVHGLGVKAAAGLRWALNDRTAIRLAAGHLEARSASGNRFTAHSVLLGVDYRFSLPTW